MKKFFSILILSLAFILLPRSVFASDVTFYINDNIFTGENILVFGNQSSYTLKVEVLDQYLANYYVIYFGTNEGNSTLLDLYTSGGCTTSCFGQGYYIKQMGLIRGSYYYAMVLPRGKADCGVGTGMCIITNYVTIYKNSGNFNIYVMGTDYLDDDSVLNNNYQGFLDVINNQNSNTQSIINNNTNNTQSIINNQNQNASQAHQDSQAINNTLNDDSIPTDNSSTASDWASANASDTVVSDMVLMPITLLTAFSNGFNGSCSSYNLGSLYGTNLTLPCINVSSYLGSTLWGIIDVLMSGFLIYGIGKKFVKVFNDFTNLKDSQVDELYGGGNE